MGMFRQAVGWMGVFISMLPGMFFLGLTAASFLSSRAARGTCQAPTPGYSCNADALRQRINTWLCDLIMMMLCSASIIFYVWMLLGTTHSGAVRMWRYDNEKILAKKAKHGIACIAGWKRKVVLSCFCLAIAFSFGSSICAMVALDLSLKIIPLVMVGVFCLCQWLS